ncbi:hypothetical protein QR680_016373 [Steinernema hermaphroditum]|uniref:Uncharacterized protein n=1 Tax=Steinernema hermaphroditum TaxID=289476 RepID=A0AA39HD00_9BILA|nr:hypothetical protein QR680_016373 [Steinernema hermaphroditum]
MPSDAIGSLLYYLIAGVGLIFGLFFIYIVVTKSPPTLRVYRNTILNLVVWYMIAMFTFGFMQQPINTMYEGRSCPKFVGLVSYFDRNVHVAVTVAIGISCENTVLAMCICFFYRYDQIRGLNATVTSRSSYRMLICGAIHVVGSLVSGMGCYLLISSANLVKSDGAYMMCFEDSNYSLVAALNFVEGLAITVAAATITVLSVKSIRILKSKRELMCPRTYRLQKRLTLSLVIMAILPILFDFVPFIIGSVCMYFKFYYSYLVYEVACRTPFLEVVLSCAVTLGFVTPYREAILRIVRKKTVIPSIVSIVVTSASHHSET